MHGERTVLYRGSIRALLISLVALLSGCVAQTDEEPDFGGPELAGADVAVDVPALVAPEIIISHDGGTLHLFDRVVGFSRVYPVSLGPTSHLMGHFNTSPNPNDGWFYIRSRTDPSYYWGLPFVRLNVKNNEGSASFGLHGPIYESFRRGSGYSHGCVRMLPDSIREVYAILHAYPGVPVTVQQEWELDANGQKVDVPGVPIGQTISSTRTKVDTNPPVALFPAGVAIPYGASAGSRFIGDACIYDADCDSPMYPEAYCHSAGFCTMPCDSICPSASHKPGTVCLAGQNPGNAAGYCVSVADGYNWQCRTSVGVTQVHAETLSPITPEANVCFPKE